MTTAPVALKSGEILKKIIYWVSIVFGIYEILFITGYLTSIVEPLTHILPSLQLLLYPQASLPIHLGFMLTLTFLLYSGGKGKQKKVPWYDWVLGAVGLGWNIYLIANFDSIYLRLSTGTQLSTPEVVSCWISFLILLEATRRTNGMAMAITGAIFLVYPMLGQFLPGMLTTSPFSFERVARGMGLFVNGIYGDILNISATIIFGFMLFGTFLNISGAGDWFLKICNSFMGTIRGGSSKVTIVANALMGMIQGSGVAIVASIGVITIPMMKKNGYTSTMAAAIEAASANGGQIMPPVMGIAAFLMVDFLGIGYDRIMLAAAIPAIIYFLALFFQTDFEAARLGLKGIPREELPKFKPTMREGWFYLIPIVFLLVMIGYFNFSPQISAVFASVIMIGLSWLTKDRHIGIRQVGQGLVDTCKSMVMIAIMCALAGVIISSVNITGLSFRLSNLLLMISGNSLPILLILTAVVAIILGIPLPTSAVYVVLATLIAPTLVKMGIEPMAAHLFLFYFGVCAMVTPPVCPAAFVAAAIASSPPQRTGWVSSRLGIAGFVVPFVFVFKPDMLLQNGNILMGLWNGVEATVIVFALAAALGGYMFGKLNLWQRIVLALGGLVMLYPYSWVATLGGIVLACIPFLIKLVNNLRSRRDRISPA